MDAEHAKDYGIVDEILVGGKLAAVAGGDSAKE